MNIIQEINRSVRELCKTAQAAGYVPMTGNAQIDAYTNLANTHLLRGVARGAKEVIPGLVDGIIGTGSGLINGAGHWLGGGRFSDGWNESTDFVKKYYSNPIRKAEMAVGGSALKKMFDGAQKYHQKTIEKEVGAPTDAFGYPRRPYWEYRKALDDMASIEDGVAIGSELLLSAPMAVGPISKAGKIPAAVAATGIGLNTVGSGGLSWMDAAKVRRTNMAQTTDAMSQNADELVEALKKISQTGWEDLVK